LGGKLGLEFLQMGPHLLGDERLGQREFLGGVDAQRQFCPDPRPLAVGGNMLDQVREAAEVVLRPFGGA